jgi:transporter family-2 protein
LRLPFLSDFVMTTLSIVLILVAVLLGSFPTLQAGINANAGAYLGHALWGAVTNTTIATLTLLTTIVLVGAPMPTFRAALAAPPWIWTGGILGAAMVFGGLSLAPRLGAASFVSATIVGTVLASMLIDHFGLVGYRTLAITPWRLFGAGLVIAGMLVLQFQR